MFAVPTSTLLNYISCVCVAIAFVHNDIVRGDGPTAVKSQLGYLLSGPLTLPQPVETATMHIAILSYTSDKELSNQNLSSFWQSESAATAVTGNVPNDMFFQQYMRTQITVQPDGTYSLRFPWKEDHSALPSNYSVCYRRTRSLAHRLAKTPELLKQYGRIIEERKRRGFIERVDSNDHKATIHYIPHHPVRKESPTTPIRIVYDCSCKQSHNSASLNDCLHAGPHFLMISVLFSYVFGNTALLFWRTSRKHSSMSTWTKPTEMLHVSYGCQITQMRI